MHAPLLVNNWIGKALGFTCAWLWAPTHAIWLPLMLIAGIALGHLYDWWAASKFATDASPNKPAAAGTTPGLNPNQPIGQPSLQFMFAATGRLAKLGGQVKATHIQYAQSLIAQLKLDKGATQQAITWFEQGKLGKANFSSLAKACLHPQAGNRQGRQWIMHHLCQVAAIDTTRPGMLELKKFGTLLGFSPVRPGNYSAMRTASAPVQTRPRATRKNEKPLVQTNVKKTRQTRPLTNLRRKSAPRLPA